jgi:hypothetical protein
MWALIPRMSKTLNQTEGEVLVLVHSPEVWECPQAHALKCPSCSMYKEEFRYFACIKNNIKCFVLK